MAPITWTKDGPMGEEAVRFSADGIRIAVVGEDGVLEDFDHWDLQMFGGVMPSVGDHFVTLWPGHTEDAQEHFRVLARYYVGEFAGDNCWWLLVAPEPMSARETELFALARAASVDTRKRKRAQATQLDEKLNQLRKKTPLRAKATTSALDDERPHTPETLAGEWGVSAQHVRDLIRKGDLPHFRIGRLLRISVPAARKYEADHVVRS